MKKGAGFMGLYKGVGGGGGVRASCVLGIGGDSLWRNGTWFLFFY